MPNPEPLHINDYLNQLYSLRDEAAAQTREAAKAILAKNAARGLLRSGNSLVQLAGLIEMKFDETLTSMLDALHHARTLPELNYEELREQTFLRAQDAIAVITGASEIDRWCGMAGGAAQNAISNRLAKLPARLQLRMRQFEVGLDSASRSEGAQVTNNIVNAHSISGVVQQAGPGSTLSASLQIDLKQVDSAVTSLQAEIERSDDRTTPNIRQLASDIGAIRSQLTAPSPRQSILREAGQSIRNVAEGAVGGVLSPSLIAAAMTVAHLLSR